MSKRLTLAVSASSAIWKVCPIVEELRKKVEDLEITIVMTHAATKFIQPLMLQTMSSNHVYVEVEDEDDPKKVSHIFLAQSCDVFLLVPATSNTIAKMRQGICDNMVTSVVSALPKTTKKFIAPAMNNVMYDSFAVQENLAVLKERGFIEIPPRVGILSSGQKAMGALAEVEDIVAQVQAALNE